MIQPRLFAFDLDGTLLDSTKRISAANAAALKEMANRGAIVALASGRLGSSMRQFVSQLGMDPAMLTLNGAEVYMDVLSGSRRVHSAALDPIHAEHLIEYAQGKPFALNYYYNDKLYTVKNDKSSPWIDLYYQQTSTNYVFLEDFASFEGRSPSKIIFIGDPSELDLQEKHFRSIWGEDSVYICRTWIHYLEFLNVNANKGSGLKALASSYGISLSEVAAFGDAPNDIPMLSVAGLGVAMKNSEDKVKESAARITEWTNDQDGVAREWERIKSQLDG